MRIVYISDFFHPDAGYQDNILTKYWVRFGNEVILLTSELKKLPAALTEFFDCTNIREKDSLFEKNNNVKIIRVPLISYKSGRSIYSKNIFKIIKKIAPDIVFVNGNDSLIGMQLTYLYKLKKVPYILVLDSHMLEMASENPFRKLYRFVYRKFFASIIINKNIPVIRTQDDDYVEKCLGIPLNRCPFISFGTDTLLFHPDDKQKKQFREENNIPQDDFVVLYAGKLSKNKGIDILTEVTGREITKKKNITFIIIGNSNGDFGQYIEMKLSKSRHRVLRFPTQKYTDLCKFYQAADIAVYPKECSLSFYDVQACGLPVVFENNNINISRSVYGNAIVFCAGDVEDFTSKIRMLAEMDENEFFSYSNKAITFIMNNYKYEDKAKEYLALFQKKLEKQKIKRGEMNNDCNTI